MSPTLTSTSNPKIRHLLTLDKARERRKENLFSIEGLKELLLAKEAGYKVFSVFYCEEMVEAKELISLGFGNSQLQSVSKQVFEKIAYRETTGGVVGIAEMRHSTLAQLTLNKNPLLLILEAVEKPGNLGAILRTADAAGVDAVICCDPQSDFYNPNVIRSSVGCVFTNQIAVADTDQTIEWLRKNQIKIFCTYLEGSVAYTAVNYNQPCAIVMGSEASGLTEEWVKNADSNIVIPMKGKIDSMNVSVSAAITVFEALRQRAD
ncbi:MAG: RNA methyltransferase [Cyclobacteriaceae bacterium]